MINSLFGTITDINVNEITLDVNGIGYQVFVPQRLALSLKQNTSITMYLYTHVREDLLQLYGFTDKADKQIFMQLLSVSGVGAKTALSILGKSAASEIAAAISNADVEYFSQIPGIGKKSAQRIIVDLKPKLGAAKELDLVDQAEYSQTQLALKSLGFSSQEAKEALAKIINKDKLSESELIKQALRQLGK